MKITEEVEECIRNLEKAFKRELSRRWLLHRCEHVAIQVASCLNIPKSTVYRVLRQNKNNQFIIEDYQRKMDTDEESQKKEDRFI